MQKINLVYDGDYADADILLVPQFVCDRAMQWSGLYSEWLTAQGRTDMETEGFVDWLNRFYCTEDETVQILAQHVTVSEDDRSIGF